MYPQGVIIRWNAHVGKKIIIILKKKNLKGVAKVLKSYALSEDI